ncbi:MAG TPA: undecaprenyldiphospho-muramoylpentapeptide beta-N-acetylglucosaminyltransferase [Planctomycetaceae bacterium]|nr:undecaprenyldiphospho-muramoylpentapeptide beta-N-acetylglucosaminyltransferase [Planctomycetaceae bacterium]
MTARPVFLFAGGGTGGHLFPGIALVEALRLRRPEVVPLFVGSDREIERRIMQQHGLAHRAMSTASLRDLTQRPDRFVWRNWRAAVQASQIIEKKRPELVIGLGGFASAPLVWAAHRARVPVVLLEQNAIPGRATCWLAPYAKMVCTTFPESLEWIPTSRPVIVSGNPIRSAVAELFHEPLGRSDAAAERTLLVLGGSQGADGLNTALMELVRRHHHELSGWTVIHQTGPRQLDSVRATYRELGQTAVVHDFFEDLTDLYRRADVVISRAGATTMSELACAGKPTVLVPYPHAADNHQRANAESFARQAAAVIVEQASACPETAGRLWSVLEPLLRDPNQRLAMGQAARDIARPDAADRVLDLLLDQQRTAA